MVIKIHLPIYNHKVSKKGILVEHIYEKVGSLAIMEVELPPYQRMVLSYEEGNFGISTEFFIETRDLIAAFKLAT